MRNFHIYNPSLDFIRKKRYDDDDETFDSTESEFLKKRVHTPAEEWSIICKFLDTHFSLDLMWEIKVAKISCKLYTARDYLGDSLLEIVHTK